MTFCRLAQSADAGTAAWNGRLHEHGVGGEDETGFV